MRSISLIMVCVAALLGGCAQYEYDITRPPELARHIGSNADQVFTRDPVEYRMRAVSGRLVVRIYNPTDTNMTLLGQQSTVVDPGGQSHPLPTQMIAAHSFVKLIFPPLQPHIERTGPSIGIGFGTMIGSARRRNLGLGEDDFIDDQPQYMAVYDDPNDAQYWAWSGESSIRLTVTIQQGEQRYQQEFVIARRKM